MRSKTKSRTVPAGIPAITVFLPIFEAIDPDNFAHLVGSTDVAGEIPFMGHLEYHPAVYKFMDACYENGMVLSFDWGAWSRQAHRYMRDPPLVMSAKLNTCMKLLTAHLRQNDFATDTFKKCSSRDTSPPYYEGFNSLRSETHCWGRRHLAHRSPQGRM